MGNIEEDLKETLNEQERQIASTQDSRIAPLSAFSERLGVAEAQLKEIQEALEAGDRALVHLDKAGSFMSSASNWDVWDMVGGGRLATHVKHFRIDDARGHIRRAQVWLERFRENWRTFVSSPTSGYTSRALRSSPITSSTG